MTTSTTGKDASDDDKLLRASAFPLTADDLSSFAAGTSNLSSEQLTELIATLKRQQVLAEAAERAAESKMMSASALALFDWQREALSSWEAANFQGVVEAVTGTGKTRIGLAAILEASAAGLRTVIFVPSLALQQQWIEQINALLPGLDVADAADARQDATWDVTVITIQSAIRRKLLRDGEQALLVADECHRYGAPKFQAALRPELFSMRLGLSATRQRGDLGDSKLDRFFGSTCFELGYERAVSDDLIAPFKIAFVRVPFTPLERERYDELSEEMRKARTKLIGSVPLEPVAEFMHGVQQLANDRSDKNSGVARWFLKRFSDRRALLATSTQKQLALRALTPVVEASQGTLVFTQTKHSATVAANVLNDQGVSSAAVDSGIDSDERVEVIRLLGAGQMKALAAPTLLDEGIDLPRVDLGIVISATHQRRQMIQRFGRVLRKKPDGATAKFVIFVLSGSSEDPTSVTHDPTLADELRPFAAGSENFDLEVAAELDRLINFLAPEVDRSKIVSFRELSAETAAADDEEQATPDIAAFIFVPNGAPLRSSTANPASVDWSTPTSSRVPERVRMRCSVDEEIEPSRHPEILGPGDEGDKYYQNDIRKNAVLTRQEEHTLMQQIRDGEAAKRRIDNNEAQTRAELKQLRKLVRTGNEAETFFVVSNLRLVQSIARQREKRVSHLELLDLIQEGNLGLLRAIEKFDHTRGTKFSTYATYWIRQSMGRAIDDTERLIRVPVHMAEQIRKLTKIRSQREQAGLAELNDHDLADLAGEAPEAVRKVREADWQIVGLEGAPDVVDDKQEQFEEDLEQRELWEQVDACLPYLLSAREELVIRQRFGFGTDDDQPATLDEIGALVGVTRERVRQIQKAALKKLRAELPSFLGLDSAMNSAETPEIRESDLSKSSRESTQKSLHSAHRLTPDAPASARSSVPPDRDSLRGRLALAMSPLTSKQE